MSAFAELYLIDEPTLTGLKAAAAAAPPAISAYMAERMREIATFDGSGWIFATLLSHLQNKYDIHLLHDVPNIIGVLDVVFTAEDREAYLDRLDPNLFALDELRDAFNDFNRANEPDAGEFMREGIAFLREGLRNVTSSNLVLLTVR